MVGLIGKRLVAAQDRYKKYADQTKKDREYEVRDSVLLKRIRPLAYELALPPNLQQVHNLFRVSMLRKYHADARYVIEYEQVDLQPDLTHIEQPVRVMDQKEQVPRN
ncbi:uncharacterized protein LOC141665567 [Apium graveolens]|uniref:uncharacterized protein LOC141665567 n=1 Tax=Apium graveolens TaxID=4045 RepID=UPI003D7B3E7C